MCCIKAATIPTSAHLYGSQLSTRFYFGHAMCKVPSPRIPSKSESPGERRGAEHRRMNKSF